MDQLLENFNLSFLNSSDDPVSDNGRKKQYKSNEIGKSESLKARRRAELLEDYKRRRSTLVNKARGLINDDFKENYGDEWMAWSEVEKGSGLRSRVNPHCKDQLMLSEWLLDRPEDLETGWTCVLCPKGRRCLVVAKRGVTQSYVKSGFLTARFKSILPNGSPTNKPKGCVTILDCVWMASTKQLFALDVLHWCKQPLLDCDAQFRLYWLKTKLGELSTSQSKPQAFDFIDIVLPPHCLFSDLSKTLAASDPSQVDGILFYHNQAPYVSGQTPLVGWLKPFMLPERFGLPVPDSYLALRPPNYLNLEQWVAQVSHQHKRTFNKEKTKKLLEADEGDMDCSDAQVVENEVF